MLQTGNLDEVFQTYWGDMEKCRQAKAYWSLLHVTICLPHICVALQSEDGEAKKKMYIAWCDRYFSNPYLTGSERYRMRCKVLHQGRAKTNQLGRYRAFTFGQSAQSGAVDHMRVDGYTLHIDVGELATETRGAVEGWIRELEARPTSVEALNVSRNLPLLVTVTPFVVTQALPHPHIAL